LIVDLQDTDKIGHTGSISGFDPNRNLGIGCGPVPLPKPHEQISDVSHGVLSAANYGSRYHLLERQGAARSGERAAGATPPTSSRNCRIVRPVPLLFTLHSWVAPSTSLAPLCTGMKGAYEGRLELVTRDKSTMRRFGQRPGWHRYLRQVPTRWSNKVGDSCW